MLKKFFPSMLMGALICSQLAGPVFAGRIHPSRPLRSEDQIRVLAYQQLALQPVAIQYTVREGDLATVEFEIPSECYSAWESVHGTIVSGPANGTLTKGADGLHTYRWQTREGDGQMAPHVANTQFVAERSITIKLYITVLAPTVVPMTIVGTTPIMANVTTYENTVNYFAVEVANPAGQLAVTCNLTDPLGNTEVATQSETSTTLSFGYDDDGIWTYTMTITDGTTTLTHSWTITVVDVPRLLIVNVVGIGDAVLGQSSGIDFTVDNPEGYTLEYVTTFPGGVFSNTNTETKTLTWTPLVAGPTTGTVAVSGGDTEAVMWLTVTVVAADTGDTTPPTVLDAYYIGVENNNGITADVVVTAPIGGIFNPRIVGDMIGGGLWSYDSGLTPDSVIGNQAHFLVPVGELQDFGVYTSNGVVFPYSEVEADWEVYLVTTDGYTYHLRAK